MCTTLVCDNLYQLYVGQALCTLRSGPATSGCVVSIGDDYLEARAEEAAGDLGWRSHHIACPPAPLGQFARAAALKVRTRGDLHGLLGATRQLLIFNDTHPCTVQIRACCRGATVTLIEEGTGLHRSRPVGMLSARRWLGRLLVPGLNVSGRQGEAPWVDALWVSHEDTLTPVQRRKHIMRFDRAAIVGDIRRRWGTVAQLPGDGRPVLLFLGQPFVEDRVLTRRQLEAMLGAVSAALPGDLGAWMLRAYKPHPREQAPAPAAARLLGRDVLVLDQHVPLESMDFGGRRMLVLFFTSGAVRGLTDGWRCVSLAGCFPALASEIGGEESFSGVTFLRDLGGLPAEVATFLEPTAGVQEPELRGDRSPARGP